ncbi:MAG: glycosyltransferase family A protein [Planctomycetota bacterium]
MPRVSVVIPSYNRLHLLPEALGSVRIQDSDDLEILVVDDGSTDGTADADLGPDVRVIGQENGGPSAARNLGVREARADLVAFLDSDDRWKPGKLEAQLPLLEADPAAVVAYAREEAIDETGAVVHIRPESTPTGDVLADLVEDNFLPTSTVVVRREAFLAAGGFDEQMTHSEDWDLWLRLAEAGRFVAAAEVLSTYRFHEDQLIRDGLALSRGKLRVYEKAYERLRDRPRPARRIRVHLADRRIRLGRRLLKRGEREEGVRLLARAKGLTPFSGLRAIWALVTTRGPKSDHSRSIHTERG